MTLKNKNGYTRIETNVKMSETLAQRMPEYELKRMVKREMLGKVVEWLCEDLNDVDEDNILKHGYDQISYNAKFCFIEYERLDELLQKERKIDWLDKNSKKIIVKILKTRIKELYKIYRICQKIAMDEKKLADKDSKFIASFKYHKGRRNAYKNMIIETIRRTRYQIQRGKRDALDIEWVLT